MCGESGALPIVIILKSTSFLSILKNSNKLYFNLFKNILLKLSTYLTFPPNSLRIGFNKTLQIETKVLEKK